MTARDVMIVAISKRAGRASRIALVALTVLGAAVGGVTQAAAWNEKQLTAQQRYLACKARLQKDPPCNENWTRQCARRCHARYI